MRNGNGGDNLFSVLTFKFFAIVLPPAMASLRFLLFSSYFLCFLHEKCKNSCILCQLVTFNIHLLLIPSLCMCNSPFFCGPHVPWGYMGFHWKALPFGNVGDIG